MDKSTPNLATPARRHRRAFLLQAACVVLAASLAAPALAQGLIQFSVGISGATRYQVRDDGTGLGTLPFPQGAPWRIFASTRSDYPGGRQHLYVSDSGSTGYGNLRAWSEGSGQNKAVTNFQSPFSVYALHGLWSNDGLDSFVSFTLLNTATGRGYTCRAHVSAADITSPSYQPITLNDPRLEIVKDWQGSFSGFYWWGHDGSRFYYKDPRSGKGNLIRAKIVGVGTTIDDDPIVFAAPVELSELRVIPPVGPPDPMSDRYLVATALPMGTGILAIDLGSQSCEWLDTGTGSLGGPRGPCFSPDGSFIAFGNSRTVGKGKKAVTTYGVHVVPFIGGPVTQVTEVIGPPDAIALTVNNWNAP